MPEADRIVFNTGPVLALMVALEDLSLLETLYTQIVVPREVKDEVLAGDKFGFGVEAFAAASFLTIRSEPIRLTAVLSRSLDLGEAAVIQTAADLGISTVCIDEAAGRRAARLHGLLVTGSLGVLLKAVKRGHDIDLEGCISRMRDQGIWISESTRQSALAIEKEERGKS